MDKKKLIIIAGIILLALTLMSASAGVEDTSSAKKKKGPSGKTGVLGIGGIGKTMDKNAAQKNLVYGVYGAIQSLFSKEGKRFQDILNNWKTKNVFKSGGPYGYGDFLAGKMPNSDLMRFKQELVRYRAYLDTPAAWGSKTKERVKNRYKKAAELVLSQINLAIQKLL